MHFFVVAGGGPGEASRRTVKEYSLHPAPRGWMVNLRPAAPILDAVIGLPGHDGAGCADPAVSSSQVSASVPLLG
jgi:hypothetical protein